MKFNYSINQLLAALVGCNESYSSFLWTKKSAEMLAQTDPEKDYQIYYIKPDLTIPNKYKILTQTQQHHTTQDGQRVCFDKRVSRTCVWFETAL